MYYGVQLAASGALTGLYRTDVLANNLANVNTAGYKPDVAYTRQRDVVRAEDGLWGLPSNVLLEKLGAGVHMAPNAVDFSQGGLTQTGNDLDVAVRGDGFLVLDAPGEGGAGVLLTRDGRMTRDTAGRLVNASTGLPVLDTSNRPITVRGGEAVSIDADGLVTQSGAPLGRIKLVDVEDRDELKKHADSTFSISAAAFGRAIPATGGLDQGMIEGSAVNPIAAMMGVQSAAKSVGTNINMISYQDRMMERAINTFARIG